MLIIRRAQMRVFKRHLRRDFERMVVAHLREHFPDDCAQLGDEGLRDRVHDGVRRAARWGLGAERDVRVFIDLMFALGPDFDADPSLPWARAILTDRAHRTPRRRLAALRAAAIEHLDHVP